MKYGDEHFAKVAQYYILYDTIAEVQDHFPSASYSSVARWIRECRKRGLLPPK